MADAKKDTQRRIKVSRHIEISRYRSISHVSLAREWGMWGDVSSQGVTIDRPIVYGNVAWWLGKKAESTKTHRWLTYVRGPHNEDLSYLIRKVVFVLHESFDQPKRGSFVDEGGGGGGVSLWADGFECVAVIEQPPFELEETGYDR